MRHNYEIAFVLLFSCLSSFKLFTVSKGFSVVLAIFDVLLS